MCVCRRNGWKGYIYSLLIGESVDVYSCGVLRVGAGDYAQRARECVDLGIPNRVHINHKRVYGIL